MLKSEIADAQNRYMSSFVRNHPTFQSDYITLHSTRKVPGAPHFLPTLGNVSHSSECSVAPHWGLRVHFPDDSVGQLFISLLLIHMFPFLRVFSRLGPMFLYGIFDFLIIVIFSVIGIFMIDLWA